MSLSGTGMSEWSTGLPRRSIRTDPPSSNPAVIAAGFSDLVAVDLVNYAAARLGYDTEECIQKALEDGEIEMYQPSGGRRGYDVYRLAARGAGRPTSISGTCSGSRQGSAQNSRPRTCT